MPKEKVSDKKAKMAGKMVDKDVKFSKVHGDRQYSVKKRMELNYPKGFPSR